MTEPEAAAAAAAALRASPDAGRHNLFKPVYKYWKHRTCAGERRGEVLQLPRLDSSSRGVETPEWASQVLTLRETELSAHFAYELRRHPGLFVLPGALSPARQTELMAACLQRHLSPANKTNLDLHEQGIHGASTLWQEYCGELQSSADGSGPFSRWMQQLTWTTIGYHYDWTNKVYQPDAHTPLPADLDDLGRAACRAVGLASDVAMQAGIINYYHPKSFLGPHTDHSEFNLEQPLVSLSLGLPALFQIGGATLDDLAPTTLLLQSGDLVIMSGPSRLAYHAVPRILTPGEAARWFELSPETCCPLQGTELGGEAGTAALVTYMQMHRININLRQVYVDKAEWTAASVCCS